MNIFELLKGKKVSIMTDLKVKVDLIIESVEERHHSEDVGPSNAENDWWPHQREWTTYEVKFTTGAKRSFNSLTEIDLV